MAEFEYPPCPADYNCTESEWVAYCDRMMALPGYIVLMVLPGEEWYTGLVERSFSLDHVLDRTQFFWSSEKAHTNIGVTLYDVDGWKYAQHRKEQYEGYFPDAKFFIFDAKDEELLPVTLDWEQWLLDSWPTNKFSVKDKYGSRNIKFTVDPSRPMII